MTTPPKLGAFFICYKEKLAVEKAIDSFYKFYPDSVIYLSSDGGLDYSYLLGKYIDNFFSSLDPEETVGVTKDIERMIATNQFPILPLYRAAIKFLQRLETACNYCNSDYLLLMEPDVFLRGPLKLTGALIGPKPNVMPDHVRKFFVEKGGKDNVAWGAAAGIMNVKVFQEVYDNIMMNPDVLLELILLDPRIACYDYLLTALFSLYGFSYDENPQLTECGRNPDWRTSNHPLLHQFMENYEVGVNKHTQQTTPTLRISND